MPESWLSRATRNRETGLYASAVDRKGNVLNPGDRVRINTYPRGTAEGIVVVSPTAYEGDLPALAVDVDGRLYSMSAKSTLRLSPTSNRNRAGLRDFMNEKPKDPHYYLVNQRGWIYCVDGRFHLPGLVGSDGGGVMPKTWKTERGAATFAHKLPELVEVRFSQYAP